MVSESRSRTGGCVVRQWLFHRRRDCAFSNFAVVLALRMACGVRDSWPAGIFVADRLAQNVFPAAGPSAHQRNRAPTDSGRPAANRNDSKAAAALARPVKASADLASHCLRKLYRSSVVLYHRLGPDL